MDAKDKGREGWFPATIVAVRADKGKTAEAGKTALSSDREVAAGQIRVHYVGYARRYDW